MPLYKLFAYPNSYAMTVHAILEELGVLYEVKWVQIFTNELDPEFSAISPHGRVPALVTDQTSLFETGAIALFLAEGHPEANLFIPQGSAQRGSFLQWLHYLASTLQPDVMIQFHPEVLFPGDEDTQKRLMENSMKRLSGVHDTIEDHLKENGPYFCGHHRTILDYLFVMQAVWPEIFPDTMDDYPHLKNLFDRLFDRQAVKHVHDLHMQERRAPLKADGSVAVNGYGLKKTIN